MKKIFRSLGLIALGALLGVSRAAATTDASGEGLAQSIVIFTQATIPAERLSIIETAGGKVVRELKFINAVVMRLPAGRAQAAQADLKNRPEVLSLEEDPEINWLNSADLLFPDVTSVIRPFQPAPRPAIPAENEIPWGVQRVNAKAAWLRANYGKGVKVAVIDTGIDFTHPQLNRAVVGGWSAMSEGGDWKDDNGHGTHVSGTIAAAVDGIGVVGVAPRAWLYGVKVLNSSGSGTISGVIAGMEWAVTNKMHVANMSLGAYRGSPALKAAVEAMVKGGVTLVAAAGNSGGPVIFPAAYPGAIAVAASDVNDKVAGFSSRGPEVDFLAPGVNVPSTFMGGGYKKLSGTSMASPHVAGLAALAIAANGLAGKPSAVRAALEAAAAPVANVPVEQQGAGIIDAGKLVKILSFGK